MLALVTGGAGFIGCNLADRLAGAGWRVRILDNLARAGVERNLHWLHARHGTRVEISTADVRNPGAVARALRGCDRAFHLAAQVAVTTSFTDPRSDFDVNAGGTLNLLEAVRASGRRVPLLFTSTHKVYGGLADVPLRRTGARWEPIDQSLRERGIGEDHPLDFHSPHGCSKGAADQYVLDYARSYGLTAVVLRTSCTYGARQVGSEAQGWVAHFLRRAVRGEAITIYGDGRQVRDLLYVSDLVDAMLAGADAAERLTGRPFNLGGGPARAVSVLELLERIERLIGGRLDIRFRQRRTGDQSYYVADTRRFQQATGWRPRVGVDDGLARLHGWIVELEETGTAVLASH